jgi:hypothetical protein
MADRAAALEEYRRTLLYHREQDSKVKRRTFFFVYFRIF